MVSPRVTISRVLRQQAALLLRNTVSSQKGISYEEAALAKARSLYGASTLEEAGKIILKELLEELPRYNPQTHGELPKALLDYLERKAGEDEYYRWLLESYLRAARSASS